MPAIELPAQPKEVYDEFYRWTKGVTKDNFSALLFNLLCKSDSKNFVKLSLGFPLEAQLIHCYKNVEGWFEEWTTEYEGNMKDDS